MSANAIELFAGCGGVSTGLLDAGLRVRLGTDHNGPAMRAFSFNHEYRGARSLTADIRALTGASLLDAAGVRTGKLHLLAGGPPCQPFSIIGKRQALQDPRGDLVFEFVRLLKETEPEAFLFENVANLATVAAGSVLELLLEEFAKAGYSTAHETLNAVDYGVAQMRKRLIIVGTRGNTAPLFPPPPTYGMRRLFGELPPRTCREVLGDLPDVEEQGALLVPNHEPTHHSPAMIEAFRHLAPGTRDPKSHHDRLHPDRPSYTLRAGSGNFSPLRPVHYAFDRVITVRESARIQGFSDDFIWPDDLPRLQQYRQVGNAVPPPLASAVASDLGKQLSWKLNPEAMRGNPETRPAYVSRSAAERDADRRKRIRGASVGRLVAG